MRSPIKAKKKKCKVCGTKYSAISPLQRACSLPCAVKIAKEIEKKNARKRLREGRERLKTRSDYMKEAQIEFNRFIRARDSGLPCISCGAGDRNCKRNAGHYLSVGSHPELRFSEDNCHGQCERCNTYLSGNLVEYRKGLVQKIGITRVELLEGPHPPQKYTIEELINLRDHYRVKLKALKWEKAA